MKVLIALVAVLALATPAFAITNNRCSLAKAMHNLGVPKDELAFWTCVAEHEPSSRTEVEGPANSDDSGDYGNFQVNNFYWCQPSNGHNNCKLSCDALLTDDVISSVVCARKVFIQQGWSARDTWKYCDGILASIDSCF